MTETRDTLLPQPQPAEDRTTGVVPSQFLRHMIEAKEITAREEIEPGQIQPASLDLRLGTEAYRVVASFLPGPSATVAERLGRVAMHTLDLTKGAVLERDCVYIIPLLEGVAFKKRVSALANPKSSTGRIDVFARVITDRGTEFDRIPERYHGPLYVEVCPRAFSVKVRKGSRLVQMRVKRGSPSLSDKALRELQREVGIIGIEARDGEATDPQIEMFEGQILDKPENIRSGIAFTVDVKGDGPGSVIAYRARRNTGVIDVDQVGGYLAEDFWDEVHAPDDGRGIVLDPHDFYILASKETVRIPAGYAAEMLAYDTLVGEFRVHYAGFFDPGFGDPDLGAAGTRAVLEVRVHEVPFMIEDGQVVGRLVYEPLIAKPDKLYGQGIGSSYQRQGLVLGKHFRRRAEVL
ncbi:MAG: 2'-deoxycytidine 5'-triphosphate deaminase [Alphaproteobacteria bacterium]|nr:2'-deoxycytidine 5'-triphosphate deaminase [Alphaproteobacteria bacterium]